MLYVVRLNDLTLLLIMENARAAKVDHKKNLYLMSDRSAGA